MLNQLHRQPYSAQPNFGTFNQLTEIDVEEKKDQYSEGSEREAPIKKDLMDAFNQVSHECNNP